MKKDKKNKIFVSDRMTVGQLSRLLNVATSALKKSKAEVDKKVKEQTKDLRRQKKKLEEQQKTILKILKKVEKEKEKVAEERDKIKAILYSIGDGVFVVDKNYKIIMVNQAAIDISGCCAGTVVGKTYDKVFKFINEEDGKPHDKIIKESMRTGKVKEPTDYIALIKKGGGRVSIDSVAAPIKNKKDEVIGCVVVFRDTTKEREIDRAKSEFVSLASHQLRTPLSAINWYTEMILDGDTGRINSKQRQYLKEIYSGNQRMVELVNALLNVSRLELGTFVIQPKLTDIVEIAKDALKELAPEIKKKKIKLTTKYSKQLPKINLDNKLMFMVFQNLLSNAVKYTSNKGKVSLNIIKKAKNIEITISDTGMGIPQEQQKYIFTKLFRADNAKETEAVGTGLGLYIIKSILDRSGCKVSFQSEENKGTTFRVVIPLTGMKKREGEKQLT
jgi:two-component system phosphate regulon sensor histidine kinase PhoR